MAAGIMAGRILSSSGWISIATSPKLKLIGQVTPMTEAMRQPTTVRPSTEAAAVRLGSFSLKSVTSFTPCL